MLYCSRTATYRNIIVQYPMNNSVLLQQNASMPEVEPVMRQFTHIVAEIPEEPVNLTAQPDDNSGTFSPQMRSS